MQIQIPIGRHRGEARREARRYTAITLTPRTGLSALQAQEPPRSKGRGGFAFGKPPVKSLRSGTRIAAVVAGHGALSTVAATVWLSDSIGFDYAEIRPKWRLRRWCSVSICEMSFEPVTADFVRAVRALDEIDPGQSSWLCGIHGRCQKHLSQIEEVTLIISDENVLAAQANAHLEIIAAAFGAQLQRLHSLDKIFFLNRAIFELCAAGRAKAQGVAGAIRPFRAVLGAGDKVDGLKIRIAVALEKCPVANLAASGVFLE